MADRRRTDTQKRARQHNQSRFRESLAIPLPQRTYRSEVQAPRPRAVQRLVRLLALALCLLLVIRFGMSLFTSQPPGFVANAIFALTGWIVHPLRLIFGQPPITAPTNGFLDWPSLAAIVLVILIATGLNALARPRGAH